MHVANDATTNISYVCGRPAWLPNSHVLNVVVHVESRKEKEISRSTAKYNYVINTVTCSSITRGQTV